MCYLSHLFSSTSEGSSDNDSDNNEEGSGSKKEESDSEDVFDDDNDDEDNSNNEEDNEEDGEKYSGGAYAEGFNLPSSEDEGKDTQFSNRNTFSGVIYLSVYIELSFR